MLDYHDGRKARRMLAIIKESRAEFLQPSEVVSRRTKIHVDISRNILNKTSIARKHSLQLRDSKLGPGHYNTAPSHEIRMPKYLKFNLNDYRFATAKRQFFDNDN